MAQQQRHSVHIAERKADQVTQLAVEAGVVRSALVYSVLREAALLCSLGLGQVLPQDKRARRGEIGPTTPLHWTQGNAEYARWTALYEEAGTSPTAIVRAWVEVYIASGGDPLASAWTGKRRGSNLAA